MLKLFYNFVTFYGFQGLVDLFYFKAVGDEVGCGQPAFAYPFGQRYHCFRFSSERVGQRWMNRLKL